MNYNNQSYNSSQGKWVFEQGQTKLMTRSFLFTGISFVAIFGLSFLIYYLMPRDNLQLANNFLIISPFLILIATIMGLFLRPKASGSLTFYFFVYAFYIIAESLGFGGLFFAIDFSNSVGLSNSINIIDVASVFGVAGIMFIGMSIIGLAMSRKATMKFSRFFFAAVIAYLFASIILSITIIFTRSESTYNWIVIVSSVVGGLINLGYIVFIVSQLKQNSEFVELTGNKTLINSMAASYGFWMLISLIGLVWQLIRLLLIFNRH